MPKQLVFGPHFGKLPCCGSTFGLYTFLSDQASIIRSVNLILIPELSTLGLTAAVGTVAVVDPGLHLLPFYNKTLYLVYFFVGSLSITVFTYFVFSPPLPCFRQFSWDPELFLPLYLSILLDST